MSEKLQKVLARAGYGSRRKIEDLIKQGVISVNNKPATIGDRVTDRDTIQINGKPVDRKRLRTNRSRVIAYNKPEGEVCTRSDPEGRSTIFDHLPPLESGRWINVGRLDINSQGLILLTTDGDLANKLMHPSSEIEREYAVRVLGKVDDKMLSRLSNGVKLDDGLARFATILDAGGKGANHWYHVVIKEGRNREVRRLWESQGIKVSRLIRTRFGAVRLDRDIKPGKWKELNINDIAKLK